MSKDDVTEILSAARHGDSRAAGELLPIVYEELRRLARVKMAGESEGHTLQPTALVHEAWLRLVVPGDQTWENRAHFFVAAAEAMRRILVEHARRKLAQKRGGGVQPVPLDEEVLMLSAPADELVAIHEALEKLAQVDADAAELVKLRYFVGMTMDEAASALGFSKRTAEGLWTYARAWLKREIQAG
jgi:RNA polymerase sigma factor (TIGR02999 family)